MRARRAPLFGYRSVCMKCCVKDSSSYVKRLKTWELGSDVLEIKSGLWLPDTAQAE